MDMKKVAALIVGLLLVPALCLGARYEEKKSVSLVRGTDEYKTSAAQVPWNATYVGVFIPSVAEDGTVGIEVYQHGANTEAIIGALVGAAALGADKDTDWVPIVDLSDGQDAVIAASTYDPCFVDITPFVIGFRGHYIRFTISAQQTTADSTWWIVFGGM